MLHAFMCSYIGVFHYFVYYNIMQIITLIDKKVSNSDRKLTRYFIEILLITLLQIIY